MPHSFFMPDSVYGEGFNSLVNWRLVMICAKNYENIFKFIKISHRIL